LTVYYENNKEIEMAKYATYRIRKPDGEYFYEPVNVRSTVPVEVHLGKLQREIARGYRELGDERPMGCWEVQLNPKEDVWAGC
jgi:hypothetical protein